MLLSDELSALEAQIDDVIVKAIRKAGPFPNPPSAMADEDGVIRLSYRFVVVLRPSRGSLFRGLR